MHGFDIGVELVAGAGQLDAKGGVGDIDDARAENIRQALYLAALVCSGAILVTPYAYAYEMAALAPAALWLAFSSNRRTRLLVRSTTQRVSSGVTTRSMGLFIRFGRIPNERAGSQAE